MANAAEIFALAWRHQQAGSFRQAEQLYRQVLAAAPHHAEAWFLLGATCQALERLTEAEVNLRQAIRLSPDHPSAGTFLGNVLAQLGRLDEAAACYEEMLRRHPTLPEVPFNLGLLRGQQGRWQEALEHFRRAAQIHPEWAEAWGNFALALQMLGRMEEAVTPYRKALNLKPDYAEAHCNLGAALLNLNEPEQAALHCREALRWRPDFAEAYNNLGNVESYLGQFDEAVAHSRQALSLRPGLSEAHNNLGYALLGKGQFDDAVFHLRKALELKPDYALAHLHLANALRFQGGLADAWNHVQHARALKPDLVDPHHILGMLGLLYGDFQRETDFAHQLTQIDLGQRPNPAPLWDGSPLEGRSIWLYCEGGGFGDTLHFIRYAALLKQRGGRVIVECQPSLIRLLGGVAGIDHLAARGSALPAFDVQAPLVGLPGMMRTSVAEITARVPYLHADAALVEQWKQILAPAKGFKIGIAWQGSPGFARDRQRSFPLAMLSGLANLEGVSLISLQKGSGTEQLANGGPFPVLEIGSRLNDFMDTAAVIRNLDLVIACDSAVAHLAGGLGHPVWVALPFIPDWRWKLYCEDTPWYPSMRLFRQTRSGNWSDVFERMAIALRVYMSSPDPLAFGKRGPLSR